MNLNTLNEYGVPLHACSGFRHDEHYWERIRHRIKTDPGEFYVWLRSL